MDSATPRRLRLGINIDHVATLRNARGGDNPDPVRAALMAEAAGADGITAHLREDRRHIRDADMAAIREAIGIPLNFEMAATAEMARLALEIRPHAVCLVPEKREERTTEGGLEVAGDADRLAAFITPMIDMGARVSLFVAPDPRQVEASARVGAAVVELHTGTYCDAVAEHRAGDAAAELVRLTDAASQAGALGLEVHMGHGITYDSVGPLAAIPQVVELNIGHFLIGEAVFRGLEGAMAEMRRLMDLARGAAVIPDLSVLLLAFAAVTFAPGPANLSVALVAASGGLHRALPMAFGLAAGLSVWGVLASLGLGAMLAASEEALMALRLCGGCYLLWLACRAARAAGRRGAADAPVPGGRFRDGLLLNLSNPKAVFAWLAALSMGLGPADGPAALALATGGCMVVGLVNYLTWSLVFSRGGSRRLYARARRWIDGACAAMFAVAGLGLLRQAFGR